MWLMKLKRKYIPRAKQRQSQYHGASELGLLIEMLLSNARVICIKASKRKARERRKREKELEANVKELENSL